MMMMMKTVVVVVVVVFPYLVLISTRQKDVGCSLEPFEIIFYPF
jgi:hypothetical protein